MEIKQLRKAWLPGDSDFVIHMVGRDGPNYSDLGEIASMTPQERLEQVLHDQKLRAFVPFQGTLPVVCAAACTLEAIGRLISIGRYKTFGLGFSKQFFFERGGAPVLYVRADEWSGLSGLSHELRARVAKYWPGAEPSSPCESLDAFLRADVEFDWEREWRVLDDLQFDWGDVAFLVLPDVEVRTGLALKFSAYGDEYRRRFESVPVVVFNERGEIVHNEVPGLR